MIWIYPYIFLILWDQQVSFQNQKKKCLKIFYINLSYFCFVNVFSVLDFRLHLPWRMEGTITESKHIFQGSGSSLHSRSLYVLLLRCNGLSSRPAESSWRRWKCSESNKKYIFFKSEIFKREWCHYYEYFSSQEILKTKYNTKKSQFWLIWYAIYFSICCALWMQ